MPETAAALRALQTGKPCGTRPQSDRRDVGRPAARPVARRDQDAACQSHLRCVDHHRRLVGPRNAGVDGRRDRGLPAAVGQAGHRLREPARAGGWRSADPARRARVHRRRELHRCAGRHAAGRRWQTAGDATAIHGPEVAIDDFPTGSLDEAQAKALFARFGVPCRTRSRSSPHRRKLRRRPHAARAVASCSRSSRARSRTRATWAAWPSI